MRPLSTFTRETIAAAAPPVAPPLERPGRDAVFDSDGGARLATFRRPSAFWMRAIRGRSSVMSPNSTRPVKSGRSLR